MRLSATPRATHAVRARPGATRVGRRQPRPDPTGPVTERLRNATDVGRDDRQAAGKRLGDHHAVGLGARRQHEQVSGGVAPVEIPCDARPREADAFSEPVVEEPADVAVAS